MVVDGKEKKKFKLKIKYSERSFALETILNIETNEVYSKNSRNRNYKKCFL